MRSARSVKITKRFEGLKMPTDKLNSAPSQKTNVERRLRSGDVSVDGSLRQGTATRLRQLETADEERLRFALKHNLSIARQSVRGSLLHSGQPSFPREIETSSNI